MRLYRISKEGAAALLSHKLRAFFMMAGTIVGIAALVVIMAVGKGAEKNVMKRVNGFGTRAIMITAGGGKGFSPPQEGVTTLTLEDADAIRNQITGVEVTAPFSIKRGVSCKSENAQVQTSIMAIEPEWHDAWDWYAKDGEGITAEDVATLARVCLLGTTLKRELFGDQDAIGQYVQINNNRFQVKGILQTRGTSPIGGDFDDRAAIPLTTGLRRLYNQDYITNIRVKTKDAGQIVRISREIRALLHERHHITPPAEDDFAIMSAAEVAKTARGISGTLTTLLSVLAALSLIVGGVVLMNILLISVGERKREIGLRRAFGAARKDILAQFLTESLIVTLSGMVAGSIVGWTIGFVLSHSTKLPVVISWEPFALAVGFACVVGIFFGVQPARRAANLHPVDALR